MTPQIETALNAAVEAIDELFILGVLDLSEHNAVNGFLIRTVYPRRDPKEDR